MKQQEIYDVTIIGGGPAGLYSAFYSGLREMKTKLIEFQPTLGGKLNIYPEKMIWDVGGQPPITGEQLKAQLIEQGLLFHPTVVLNEKVESMYHNEKRVFVLKTSSSQLHYSKTIIVAIGSGILQPQKLTLNGANKFEMSNLHYTVKSLKRFKDKVVIISGGGDSAIDWANELEPVAKQVYLACRRNDFTCHEAQKTQIKQSSVVSLFHTSITKLVASPKQDVIDLVELTNQATREVSTLQVDEVIISHGFDNDNSLFQNSKINVEIADNYFIKGNAASESSMDGMFAAGDILLHEGKLNLIAGCFQDAANAVNKAKQFIQPHANKIAIVSSHNDIFKKSNRVLVKQMMESSANDH